jgi:SAM-dependent methyltransferase
MISHATRLENTKSRNRMSVVHWIPGEVEAVLDVGCNVGAHLSYCRELFPHARLAGVELNAAALEKAKQCLPGADLRQASAALLPFADGSFDCVTMVEVLEHVPADQRRQALSELRRVLSLGGIAIITVPHAGMFAWLDPGNFRFRAPALYRLVIGTGRRDSVYKDSGGVAWHHHFSGEELLELAGEGWTLEKVCLGGLALVPLTGILRWPFYRKGWTRNLLYRALERTSGFDLRCNYGRFSYDVLMILRRT